MKIYNVRGFKAVKVRSDGKVLLLEIATTEGDVGIPIPTNALTALIPALVKGGADANTAAGLADVRNVFDVKEVSAGLPADKNGLVIYLTLPQGLEGGTGFRVDIETARRLSQTLAELVAQSGESPKTVP